MRSAKEYFEMFKGNNNGLEMAISRVVSDASNEIKETLEYMSEWRLYAIIHDYKEDVHEMEDLDSEYEFMSVTEVLNELGWVDTDCSYFDSDSNTCSNDLWDFVDKDELVEGIYDDSIYTDDDEIIRIKTDAEELIDELKEKFEFYNKAKELFNLVFDKSPEELVNALWNMNN